ncbi:MAG TPA: hypothetical protein PLP75_01105 [Burkholderiales bacterium]|nr:hypothetical protein [Burkholderiales bacterium]
MKKNKTKTPKSYKNKRKLSKSTVSRHQDQKNVKISDDSRVLNYSSTYRQPAQRPRDKFREIAYLLDYTRCNTKRSFR